MMLITDNPQSDGGPVSPNNGRQFAMEVLHYATPLAALASFAILRVVAACFLHEPGKAASNNSRRMSTISLLIGVIATLIAQAITYIPQSLAHHAFWASQDETIYLPVSILAYGFLLIGISDNKNPIWHPYLVSFFTAATLEMPITVLLALKFHVTGDDYMFARLALQIVRSVLLVVLCLTGGWYAIHHRAHNAKPDGETEPLLGNGHVSSSPTRYDSTKTNDAEESDSDSDSNSDDVDMDSDSGEFEDKKLKKEQKKRLQASGSYLAYVKDFKIFIPLLWPSKNLFVQACIGAMVLVMLVQRVLNVLVPRQLGMVINDLTYHWGDGTFPWQTVGVWLILEFLDSSAGIQVITSLARLPISQYTYKRIGTEAFRHIMTLSMDFHNEKNSGELVSAISQGQDMHYLLDFVFFDVGPMFIDLFVGMIYVYTLFDIYMTYILLAVGVAYVWVGAKTTQWSLKRRRRWNKAVRDEGRVQVEAISNWQTVSHFNRGHYETNRYNNAIDEENSSEMKFFLAYYVGTSLQSLIMLLGRFGAMTLAIYRVSQGQAPVGSFITLLNYWSTVTAPFGTMSWSIRRIVSMLTDAERLLQLLITKATVNDKPGAKDISVEKGEVAFKSVNFAYDPRRQTVKDVSFVAKPGQTVALVGETGGGKSTILKLLYRYYDIQSGSISIDGQDIRDVTLDSLRDSFGMVPQDPALFNCTIMENVRYARLDASDEEIKDACRAAAIHDKIETFPDKYKATVGERGVKLSGGELQRISIARAILRQPRIVLLDEATSMIDAETEALIQAAFKRLTADRTTFMIAHRLSTIQHADLILVINNGEIVERGTHDELFRLGGKYTALWSKQQSKNIEDTASALLADSKQQEAESSGGKDVDAGPEDDEPKDKPGVT